MSEQAEGTYEGSAEEGGTGENSNTNKHKHWGGEDKFSLKGRTKDQDRQEETDYGYLVVISKIRHQCLFLKKLRHGVAGTGLLALNPGPAASHWM